MVQSLAALLGRVSLDDHDQILRAANDVLQKDSANHEAQHVKLVALVKLERYEEALKFLETSGPKLQNAAKLEKAYAQYKAGQLDEAAATAGDADDSRGVQHVRAQVAYRRESFEDALRIYRSLPSDAEEDSDITVNKKATEAMLIWAGYGRLTNNTGPSDNTDSFEFAYNTACLAVARGDFAQAHVFLKKALDILKTFEDMTDEEKETESLLIEVQRLYVLCKEERYEVAELLKGKLAIDKISDPSTSAIARNNALAAQKKLENPYLIDKNFVPTKVPEVSKPFLYQKSIIDRNVSILDILCHKTGALSGHAASLRKAHPPPTTDVETNIKSALSAVAQSQTLPQHYRIKSLTDRLSSQPADVGVALSAAHILVSQKHFGAATILLENLRSAVKESKSKEATSVYFAPGLIAALASLYKRQNRTTAITEMLDEASSYWLSHESAASWQLLQAAGQAFLSSPHQRLQDHAKKIYTKLYKDTPDSKLGTAGYISSQADASSELKTISKALTPVEKFISGVDVSALENSGVPANPSAASAQELARKRQATSSNEESKKKRSKPSKLPKGADPDKQPDPDRWLPIRDRASYQPKGKKNKAKAAAATQGGFVDIQERLELTDGTPVKIEKATPSSGAGKKSKKKGKK